MGFVGIDEGNQKGAGTVMFDLLLKAGTMLEYEGKLMAHGDCDIHRNYVFGDRKSIELLNAFRSDLQGRGITLNEMNEQCDEFEKVLDTLCCCCCCCRGTRGGCQGFTLLHTVKDEVSDGVIASWHG